MDEQIEAVLREYEERLAAEDKLMRELPPEQVMARVDELLIPVGRNTGRFLRDLAVGAGAKRILELGSSYGYSAIWLGAAARETGGTLISLDIAADKQVYARERSRRAGLADFVEFRTGDAVELIGALDGPFDLVLIDLWKDLYIPCLDAVRPKLASGAFVVADNILEPEMFRADAQLYRDHVRAMAEQTILLPIGSGIEVSRFE
jgi:predicted O-methyltransferase YrrM